VSWGPADEIDRTAKILIDLGLAKDPDDARRYLESLVLQVAVGPEIEADPAAQAALATVVNAGRRAYKGGVRVRPSADAALAVGWSAGLSTSSTVTRYGGSVVERLCGDYPTLVIGSALAPVGKPELHLTWDGWSGGVVQHDQDRLSGAGNVVAGVLAAGLGISETFQQVLGGPLPGRRDVGVSLWRPDRNWRSPEAVGPELAYLPASLWLLGLGHLGQANAWTIGMLPYADVAECEVGLMDFDRVIAGNTSTQLLTTEASVGARKTRVVATALERLGVRTRTVERAFDDQFHVVSHANEDRDEPLVALAGFDDIAPRSILGGAGFERIVDAGLGAGSVEYLDVVLHTFPATKTPADVFSEASSGPQKLGAAYEEEVDRQVANGADEAAVRCGMLEIAGIAVGAAFVGTIASALAVADILRVLHAGPNYSVIGLDLRDPARVQAAPNALESSHIPRYAAVLMDM
jgi:hypothetical protein